MTWPQWLERLLAQTSDTLWEPPEPGSHHARFVKDSEHEGQWYVERPNGWAAVVTHHETWEEAWETSKLPV